MYEERPKGFFEELQSLEEPTKRKVLVIASAVIMIVVVYLWLGYFRSSITAIPQIEQPIAQNGTSTPPESANGFDSVRNGTAYLYDEMMAGFRNLSNILKEPRQYIIKPQ